MPGQLGKCISKNLTGVCYFKDYHLFALPTKYDWQHDSDLDLIAEGIDELFNIVPTLRSCSLNFDRIYLVKPGCNNGHLRWSDVRPILENKLDDTYTLVDK